MLNLVKQIFNKNLLIILLSLFCVYSIYQLNNKSKTIDKLSSNNIALKQGIKTYQTKNGELYNTIQSLQYNQREFKKENKELYDKLRQMGIKVKNTQSISELQYSYNNQINKLVTINENILNDSIRLNQIIDSLKYNNENNFTNINLKQITSFKESNQYYNINGKVNLNYNLRTNGIVTEKLLTNDLPYLTDINFSVTDSLLVVPTINYKRVWLFFRKPYSVNIYIKSENPAFNLEEVKTYQIK